MSRLLPQLPARFLTVHIHDTSSSPSTSRTTNLSFASSHPAVRELKVLQGRPSADAYLDTYALSSSQSASKASSEQVERATKVDQDTFRVAVSACGPPGLLDATRESVRARLGTGPGQFLADELVYFDELFTW